MQRNCNDGMLQQDHMMAVTSHWIWVSRTRPEWLSLSSVSPTNLIHHFHQPLILRNTLRSLPLHASLSFYQNQLSFYLNIILSLVLFYFFYFILLASSRLRFLLLVHILYINTYLSVRLIYLLSRYHLVSTSLYFLLQFCPTAYDIFN